MHQWSLRLVHLPMSPRRREAELNDRYRFDQQPMPPSCSTLLVVGDASIFSVCRSLRCSCCCCCCCWPAVHYKPVYCVILTVCLGADHQSARSDNGKLCSYSAVSWQVRQRNTRISSATTSTWLSCVLRAGQRRLNGSQLVMTVVEEVFWLWNKAQGELLFDDAG